MNMKARAVVTSKGQITIPKPVRDALGLGTSDVVEFEVRGKRASMKPVEGGFLRWYGTITPRSRPENFRKIKEQAWAAAAERVVGKDRKRRG
jgi:AbrB family looped-hinge helix DNA binding protein